MILPPFFRADNSKSLDRSWEKGIRSPKSLSRATPPSGKISVGEFLIPSRGYIELKGPEITLNLVDANVLETLKFLAKSGNYGFLYINNQSNQGKEIPIPEITADFNNEGIDDIFSFS